MAQAPQRKQKFVAVKEGNAVVVTFEDQKMLDELTINEIGSQLYTLAANPDASKIVLDFGRVMNMSSVALGMLISLNKKVRERKGQLKFCCINPSIQQVFAITRLNEIFQMYTTREEAVGSFE